MTSSPAAPGSQVETLRRVISALNALGRSTEQDFLKVGQKLQDIVNQCSSDAEALAGLTGESPSTSGTDRTEDDELAHVLNEVTAWAQAAKSGAGPALLLSRLEHGVRRLSSPLDLLSQSVQTLRVVSVVTRVETARLDASAGSFDALAGEIGHLADEISEKTGAIRQSLDTVSRLLKVTRQKLRSVERIQRTELLELLSECSAGVDETGRERKRVRAVSEAAHEGYKKVNSGISDMVVALQFHDGTRQRFEHVEAVLGDLAAHLDQSNDDPGGLGHAAALQAAQLQQACDSFQEGVAQIRTDLISVAKTAREFGMLASDLSGKQSARRGLGEKVERHFNAVADAISVWISSQQTLAAAAADVVSACSGMNDFVSGIDLVAANLLDLALNARIRAVHLASSGAVMQAVAEGIRETSSNASRSADAVGVAIREVGESARSLVESVNSGGIGGSSDPAKIVERIRGIASELHTTGDSKRRLLAAISQGGDLLANEITALQGGLSADRVTLTVVASCLADLQQFVAASGVSKSGSSIPKMIERARTNYTMHAERAVHDSFSGVCSAPAVVINAAESEYGGNVELF